MSFFDSVSVPLSWKKIYKSLKVNKCIDFNSGKSCYYRDKDNKIKIDINISMSI